MPQNQQSEQHILWPNLETFIVVFPNQRGINVEKFRRQVLSRAHVVVTPGAGFGSAGEGYVRISAFNARERVLEAVERIRRTFSAT